MKREIFAFTCEREEKVMSFTVVKNIHKGQQ